MKKVIILVSLALLTNAAYASPSQTSLPFIGKRYFNFAGGSGTEQSITIYKNGNMRLEYYGSSAAGGQTGIDYAGQFKQVVKTRDGEIYRIHQNTIEQLDNHGHVKTDCSDFSGNNILCKVELIK